MNGICDFCGEEFSMELITKISGDYYCKDCMPDLDSDEEEICGYCNGSGEGQYEGTRCGFCKGRGTV